MVQQKYGKPKKKKNVPVCQCEAAASGRGHFVWLWTVRLQTSETSEHLHIYVCDNSNYFIYIYKKDLSLCNCWFKNLDSHRRFIKGGHQVNWSAVRMIFLTRFDHWQESSPYKEVQFKKTLPACENQLPHPTLPHPLLLYYKYWSCARPLYNITFCEWLYLQVSFHVILVECRECQYPAQSFHQFQTSSESPSHHFGTLISPEYSDNFYFLIEVTQKD